MRDSGSLLDAGWHLVEHIVSLSLSLHSPHLKCSIVRQTLRKCVKSWSCFFLQSIVVLLIQLPKSSIVYLFTAGRFIMQSCFILGQYGHEGTAPLWTLKRFITVLIYEFPFIALIIKMLHTEAMYLLIAATWLLEQVFSIRHKRGKPKTIKTLYFPPWKRNRYLSYFPCLVINSTASKKSTTKCPIHNITHEPVATFTY